MNLLKVHIEIFYYLLIILVSIILKLGKYGLLSLIIIHKILFKYINNFLIIINVFF